MAELPLAPVAAVVPAVAPTTVGDPDLCPTAANPDASANSIGGLSSRTVLKYGSMPQIDNLYSRLDITLKICTDSTLSSQDRTALTQILNFLGVNNAKSFAATLSVTGNASGGITFPQIVPFSYSYDDSKSTYTVGTVGQAELPWQVTDSWDISYSYDANKSLSINTASLFNGIATSLAGATAILSPAATSYLTTGNSILQQISSSIFTAINKGSDQYKLDILGNSERAIIYRFRDLSNRPLAAVRLALIFTNTLVKPVPIDPTAATTPVPNFATAPGLPNILGISIGGPSVGTLQQVISKEPSYQNLLKTTSATTPASFAAECDNLEQALQATYGLNAYDTALTMAQVLAYNTIYLTSKNFYNSGCFRSRALLKTMGITSFETAPTS